MTEPVKAEVRRELEELYDYQQQHLRETRDTAQKAADAVGQALRRLYRHLSTATDHAGQPQAVLRAFAAHLRQHLLIPSGRGAGRGGSRPGQGTAGCFTYEPPAGVLWHG